MKLLLCSDFSNVGYKFLDKFKIDLHGKNCLFVGYAQDDEFESESSAAVRLKSLGLNLIFLNKDYDFKDDIDLIFARGGNTTRLVHLLKQYNQFDKIKKLIERDVIYVGNSAGAILVGKDTSWTLELEPYEFDLTKIYGKDALLGYGLIDKLIFVHASRYRMARDSEKENPNEEYRVLERDYYSAYLNDLKNFKKGSYIRIGNNQAYFVDGNIQKCLTYRWNKIPVKLTDR